MAANPLPPQDFLRECFLYDPATGKFEWLRRPENHFATPEAAQSWNVRQAGSPAFRGRDKDGRHRCDVRYEGRQYRILASRAALKIMTNEEPEIVDHRNRDTGDDRFENLRAATSSQNNANRRGRSKTGLPKGVSFDKGRFQAIGGYKGVRYYLGSFRTPEEAHEAYCVWARQLHGEFFNAG